MSTRLILIAHAGTRLMREGGFPSPDIGLDDGGVGKARSHRLPVTNADRHVRGPDTAMAETAAALGLTTIVAPALADAAHGPWSGLAFDTVAAAEAAAFAAWISDPAKGPPGGEPLADVQRRVGGWMDDQALVGGVVLAVTSASVIRAAIAHALAAPVLSTLRIDVAPLTAAEFSFNRVWRLQRLAP